MKTTGMKPVESIKRGEYVRRKVDATKTYIRGEYDVGTKRYSLQDASDMNHEIWIKRGTVLHIGFTY